MNTPPITLPSGLRVVGPTVLQSLVVQFPFVTDAMVPGSAGIAATKLQQQRVQHHRQATGTAVVAKTEDLAIVFGATGFVTSVQAAVTTVATGSDRTITVDVQLGADGAAFATVLTGVITIDHTATAAQIFLGTLVASPLLVAGDIIRVIVAVAGSAGAQAAGLVVTIVTTEDPQ